MREPVRRFLASALLALGLIVAGPGNVAIASSAGPARLALQASQEGSAFEQKASNGVEGRLAITVGLVALGAVLSVIVIRRGSSSRAFDDEAR
ncbi:MAG: hypothetical protein ACRD2W_13865 [Acidimicrobiales bacterium]